MHLWRILLTIRIINESMFVKWLDPDVAESYWIIVVLQKEWASHLRFLPFPNCL